MREKTHNWRISHNLSIAVYLLLSLSLYLSHLLFSASISYQSSVSVFLSILQLSTYQYKHFCFALSTQYILKMKSWSIICSIITAVKMKPYNLVQHKYLLNFILPLEVSYLICFLLNSALDYWWIESKNLLTFLGFLFYSALWRIFFT